MNPTYDRLLKENRQLKARIVALEALVIDLQERLKLNSKNSSKSPSTDQKDSNQVPKKKGGAKPGHSGHFRALFPETEVDQFVDVQAKQCPTCGQTVQPTDEAPSIHQQVEIAPKPYVVTQYNRQQFYCTCCRKYGAAPLPVDVGPSAFGTRLSAFMGFLTGTCRLSRRIG